MIANKVTITGYKRFKKASVLLDRRLIAIVGPNEAGKSSFFQALLSLEDTDSYDISQLTRGIKFNNDDTIISVEYLLEKEEKELVKSFNGIGTPRFYALHKTVKGQRFHKIIGDINRDKSVRHSAIDLANKTLNNSRLKKFIEGNYYEETDNKPIVLRELLEKFVLDIDPNIETIKEELFETVEKINSILLKNKNTLKEDLTSKINDLYDRLKEFLKIEKAEHPEDKFLKYLDKKRPEFLFFSDEERFLKGEYSIKELETPPSVLNNLISLSGVDIVKLLDALKSNNTGARLKIMETANINLLNEFSSSWSQSTVYPQLLLDPDGLKIQISYTDSYTEIKERSDGLKQYIALKIFLATKNSKIPPILLIDEAELHLHYSAQSDLVSEFEKQKIVNSIIYSTHSAGCLPSDLGTGVRVVEPLYENAVDRGISIIKNSIWQNSGGFSPLLLAMGANIIAFTLARKAVIAEGPSETILLPRLLREANNLDFIEFQIAPGIANISKADAKIFELEAATVVYLVDGDDGGKENKRKLVKGGINEEKIISLPTDYSIEDFIIPEILKDAIFREFESSGKIIPNINLNYIPNSGRINWFKEIFEEQSEHLPSKVKIAENISKTPSNEAILDPAVRQALVDLYNRIIKKVNE